MAHFMAKKPSGRKVAGDAFEDVLYGNEDEEDSDEDEPDDCTSVPGHPAKSGARIRVDDDEPMDLLSGAASRVTSESMYNAHAAFTSTADIMKICQVPDDAGLVRKPCISKQMKRLGRWLSTRVTRREEKKTKKKKALSGMPIKRASHPSMGLHVLETDVSSSIRIRKNVEEMRNWRRMLRWRMERHQSQRRTSEKLTLRS